MRYHGNYCGPNWSAGRHQPSVVSDIAATDEFDQTCKVHDAAYATGSDLETADYTFAADNLYTGSPKRMLAGMLVGIQGIGRSIDRLTTYQTQRMTQKKVNLRGASTTPTTGAKTPVSAVAAPATIGSIMRGQTPLTVKKDSTSISLSVSTCVGRVPAANQSTFPELVAMQYLNPLTLGNDEVQNMVRVYQRYRIKSATIMYRPFQGTNTGGEFIIVSNDDPNYKPINTSIGSAFYQKSLATQYSILSPLWCPAEMPLHVDTGWKVCDNANSTTLEEFSSGVVYAYSDGATSIPGFLVINMAIDFEGLRFNPRNLISGSYLGLGTRTSSTVPAPTLGADGTISFSTMTIGDIYAVVLSSTSASFGVGITSSTLYALSSGSGTNPFTITGSTLVYARAVSTSSANLFSTYDAAVGSDVSDKLLFGVTTATTSTFPCTVITQLRNSTQPGV